MIGSILNIRKGTEINFNIDAIDREVKDALFLLYNGGVITGGQLDILMDMAYKQTLTTFENVTE